jgi:predicted lipoprotein with Yx(FWY)xxD motif
MGSATRGWVRSARVGLVLVAGLVVLAGGIGSASALVGSTSRTRAADTGAVVKLRKTALGQVLVDRRGRTLYLFEADEFGRSVCTAKCATFWPPLLTSATPSAAGGARGALIGTTRRSNGRLQVTYDGYPLYFFAKDSKPGDTHGQGVDGFGGEWYVLDKLGRKIEHSRHGDDPAAVSVRRTGLAPVLVDARGRTLYLFEADNGTSSHCYGKCASAWPPLLSTGKPQATGGARAALLGDTRRADGSLQVTYHGHPLYYFAKDTRAGQTLGEGIDGFGGEWYVLDRSGIKLEQHGSGSSGGGSSSSANSTTGSASDDGGYGGGYG